MAAMSEIAGIVRLDGRPAEADVVEAMLAAMDHAGSRRLASASGPACLGQLARGEDRVTQIGQAAALVVWDGRIDNEQALVRDLRLEPCPSSTLLLHAYREWGEACPARLLGDFAIVVWDVRAERLVCTRDQLGIRPLFYRHEPGRFFAFASEVKGLLALHGPAPRPDAAAVGDYLAGCMRDPHRTFYEGIARLPPAHVLVVADEELAVRRYWSPDSSRTLQMASDEEYAHAFRSLFSDAVRCRLNAHDALGVTLSGGLDSSAVVCMASKILPREGERLPAFSIVYGPGDERAYVDAVTRRTGLDIDYVACGESSPLRHLAAINASSDGPAYGETASDFWELLARAAGRGIEVLLDGCDGDATVFYDFDYLGELARSGRLRTMLREARALDRRYFEGGAFWGLLGAAVPPAVLPATAWTALNAIATRLLRPAGSRRLLSRSFARRSGVMDRLESDAQAIAALRTHSELHAYTLMHPMQAHGFETMASLYAAHAIEHRHPFSDRRLVEFCLALPREQRVERGWTRPIVRRALADLLPVEVSRRGGKKSFKAPRRLALLERRALEETASDGGTLGDFIDMRRLRAAVADYLDGRDSGADQSLWPVVSLRRWLQAL